MLNDEHQGQIGKMRVQLQEESRKAERANRARDDVMQQVERLKSEMQAQKEKFAREKAEVATGGKSFFLFLAAFSFPKIHGHIFKGKNHI